MSTNQGRYPMPYGAPPEEQLSFQALIDDLKLITIGTTAEELGDLRRRAGPHVKSDPRSWRRFEELSPVVQQIVIGWHFEFLVGLWREPVLRPRLS